MCICGYNLDHTESITELYCKHIKYIHNIIRIVEAISYKWYMSLIAYKFNAVNNAI